MSVKMSWAIGCFVATGILAMLTKPASAGVTDVTNNAVIVHTSDADDTGAGITQQYGYAVTGWAGGAMNGPGIFSSTALNDQNNVGIFTSVGVASNWDLGYGTGASGWKPPRTQIAKTDVANSDVLIAYTWQGDFDMNGFVDINDYTILSAFYNTPSGATWATGDTDYNGTVDINDYTILSANYGSTPAGLTGSAAAPGAAVPVPEPATLVLAALGLVGVGIGGMARRRG